LGCSNELCIDGYVICSCRDDGVEQEEDMAHTSIRFGIGRFTSEAEVDHAIGTLGPMLHRMVS